MDKGIETFYCCCKSNMSCSTRPSNLIEEGMEISNEEKERVSEDAKREKGKGNSHATTKVSCTEIVGTWNLQVVQFLYRRGKL